jgi:hypothetical protein
VEYRDSKCDPKMCENPLWERRLSTAEGWSSRDSFRFSTAE